MLLDRQLKILPPHTHTTTAITATATPLPWSQEQVARLSRSQMAAVTELFSLSQKLFLHVRSHYSVTCALEPNEDNKGAKRVDGDFCVGHVPGGPELQVQKHVW